MHNTYRQVADELTQLRRMEHETARTLRTILRSLSQGNNTTAQNILSPEAHSAKLAETGQSHAKQTHDDVHTYNHTGWICTDHTYIQMYVNTNTYVCIQISLYMPACMHICRSCRSYRSYKHAHMHTYMHTYIHEHIHADHTYRE